MLQYARLRTLLPGVGATSREIAPGVIDYLVDEWLRDYESRWSSREVIETSTSGFSYLFDVATGRLIAAWGISQGLNSEPRDKTRMRGHPRSGGAQYHRGHAIPHTLGGPTDINLVPQLGSVNIGAFRDLERRAVATPGALYFTYWRYDDALSQKPSAVEQCLICPGQLPMFADHAN